MFFFADNVDTDEAKGFFEGNFSHIYFILYDCFVAAETNLRQRGKPGKMKKKQACNLCNSKEANTDKC